MDSREIALWEAFELVEGPIGYKRNDWQAASVCAAATQPYMERGKVAEAKDFLLKFERKKARLITNPEAGKKKAEEIRQKLLLFCPPED